jgi:hypothetical protein
VAIGLDGFPIDDANERGAGGDVVRVNLLDSVRRDEQRIRRPQNYRHLDTPPPQFAAHPAIENDPLAHVAHPLAASRERNDGAAAG